MGEVLNWRSASIADVDGSTSDGGGPTFDDMEARVQRLEDDMKEVKSDLKALRVDVAEMKGMMKAMPTTLQLIAFAVAVFVAAGLTRYFLPA